MTESLMYWITRLDVIKSFFDGVQILAIVFAIFSSIFAIISYIVIQIEKSSPCFDEADKDYVAGKIINRASFKGFILTLTITILSAFIEIFIPTTKEMIVIKVIPAIASSEQASKIKDISNDALDIASLWLKDQVKKLEDKKDIDNKGND